MLQRPPQPVGRRKRAVAVATHFWARRSFPGSDLNDPPKQAGEEPSADASLEHKRACRRFPRWPRRPHRTRETVLPFVLVSTAKMEKPRVLRYRKPRSRRAPTLT